MTLKTLLSLDPSAARDVSNTGWAWGTYSDEEAYTVLASGNISGGFRGFINDAAVLRLLRVAETVVCEKYVIYNRAGDPSPMKIEGVVEFLRPDTIFQPSAHKNTLVPDDLMKKLGMWSTAGHHHDEREAVRHALLYLTKTVHMPTMELVRKARAK